MHSLIRENISLQAHMSSLRYPRDGAIVPQMSEPAELAAQSSSPVCVGNGDARESRNAGHTLCDFCEISVRFQQGINSHCTRRSHAM